MAGRPSPKLNYAVLRMTLNQKALSVLDRSYGVIIEPGCAMECRATGQHFLCSRSADCRRTTCGRPTCLFAMTCASSIWWDHRGPAGRFWHGGCPYTNGSSRGGLAEALFGSCKPRIFNTDGSTFTAGVQVPPGQTLQPEATGAGMEATKCLKPSDSRHAGFVRATAGRLRWAQQAQTQAAIRPRGRSTRPTRRSAFVCKPGG